MNIMCNIKYDLFIPPYNLSKKEKKIWTKKESDSYYQWFLNNIDKRILILLNFFNEKLTNNKESDLLRLGDHVAKAINIYPFSIDKSLTSSGYAISADIGLLVANFLHEENPLIKWTVLRKPKSDISYNLPVLIGFGKLFFDPVGGSIAEANAILAERRSFSIWKDIYSFWKKKAEEVV